ncbi:helix-turn-helix domain-containing protein [Streptococcus equi subsp. zooepidemicus]|uniref:helix-turn-helix domain-containing protein n=1 Tax=Streptococcus equi TaxID=1336 RepID=UPI001E32A299|nr:helix-turn-helix domain-containing protein [Streptococcus equi]MCD3432804.1 helix-turn-helix domain-containing protein [Streptococcus equi subsp. zooepidemicus]HEK9984401.1 helix-turn-helix domain-containing protein [Streptococcus equi subsp. zooepidemicus]HEL1086960.1 helix-turn-helix domain-containing protein [Streptococcus equi subsp. zooepidemicus]
MRETSLGELLRETRVGKNITLDEIEAKTGISSHYLLAMELDQFKIIPEEKFGHFLKQYADIVGLDFDSLKRLYQLQVSFKKETGTPSVTQIVEEKLSKKRLQENSYSETIAQPEPSRTQPETLVIPVKTSLSSTKSAPTASHFKATDHRRTRETSASRLSRYGNSAKTKKSAFPSALLGLIAVAIVGVVVFAVWKQFDKGQKAKEAEMSFLKSSQSSHSTASSSSEPKTVITTEGAENYLIANITKSKEAVDVTVSLTDAESSWISLTNSEIGEAGMTLTKDNPSYSTILPAETTESLLTLGVTKGVSVAIDGQPLDLSAMTSTDISYITLKIQ